MEGVSMAKNAVFSEKAQKYMNASSISWQTQAQKHPVTLWHRTDFSFSALLSFSSHLSRINLKQRVKSELGVGKRWRVTLCQYGTSPPSESALDIRPFSVFHSCSCRGCDTDEDPAITLPSKKTYELWVFIPSWNKQNLTSVFDKYFFFSLVHTCAHMPVAAFVDTPRHVSFPRACHSDMPRVWKTMKKKSHFKQNVSV